jgi:hypothetical protein
MRSPRWLSIAAATLLGLSASWACDLAGGIGAPCESNDDCDDDLTCDEHDGKASCQIEHGHGDDEDTKGHDTEGHDTEDHDTEDHDGSTGEGTGSTSDGAADDDVEELQAACTTLCSCVQTNCSDVSGYPFEEAGTCMNACMTYTVETASCFQSFCEDVPDAGELVEHDCQHAWGGLGQLEC